eukprot:scaffold5407_cov132-Cylindrotheca_fusiformis.AAC.4
MIAIATTLFCYGRGVQFECILGQRSRRKVPSGIVPKVLMFRGMTSVVSTYKSSSAAIHDDRTVSLFGGLEFRYYNSLLLSSGEERSSE